MIEAVDWESHIEALDPTIEQIVLKARAAILEHHRQVMGQPVSAASAAAAAASAGAADGQDVYVGVTRYLRWRWHGGEHLEPDPGTEQAQRE